MGAGGRGRLRGRRRRRRLRRLDVRYGCPATSSPPRIGDVGYLIAPWARGRGYAPAALRACATGASTRWACTASSGGRTWATTPPAAWPRGPDSRVEGAAPGRATASHRRRASATPGSVSVARPRDAVHSMRMTTHRAGDGMGESDGRLHGDGVVLRPFRTEDADDVAAGCNDPLTQRFLPLLPGPYTRERRALVDHRGRTGRVPRRGLATRSPTRKPTGARGRRRIGGCGRRGRRDRVLGGAVGAAAAASPPPPPAAGRARVRRRASSG